MKKLLALIGAVALGVTLTVAGGPSAGAAGYAPVDTPGPALGVPAAQLAASLHCTADVAHATREPVLLLSGTTLTTSIDFGYNYEPWFAKLGIPYCTSDSPTDPYAMGDIQTRGEYVTYAIRTMYELAGRRIAVLGHSQGGMVGRWSLRFWPDTRAMVDDVIGLAPSNHGTIVALPICALPCAAAFSQQRSGSAFDAALNSGQETFPGISYTDVYTQDDEVVQPNLDSTGSSSLHGGGGAITNVAVQDICPVHVADHLLLGTTDPVGAALVLDALTHAGPADPDRISRSVCGRLLMPGATTAGAAAGFLTLTATVATQLALAPRVTTEPALACYVTASCKR